MLAPERYQLPVDQHRDDVAAVELRAEAHVVGIAEGAQAAA